MYRKIYSAGALTVLFFCQSTALAQGRDFCSDSMLRLYHTQHRGCGIAAVYMVLRQFGYAITLENILQDLPVGESGTSMAELRAFLVRKGFQVDCIEGPPDALFSILSRHPEAQAITLIGGDHWVASHVGSDRQFSYFSYPTWQTADISDMGQLGAMKALIVWPPDCRNCLTWDLLFQRGLTFLGAATLVSAVGLTYLRLRVVTAQ